MRKLLVAGLLVTGMALAGCDNPPLHAYQSKFDTPQIVLTDWVLQQDLRVTKAITNRVGSGQLQVAIELENNTDHNIKVDYRYWYLDKNGATVDSPSSWQFTTVPSRAFQQFSITSMSSAADDFHVEIRPHQ